MSEEQVKNFIYEANIHMKRKFSMAQDRPHVMRQNGRVVFTGPTGSHSIDISVSTVERAWAHLDGFVANTRKHSGANDG